MRGILFAILIVIVAGCSNTTSYERIAREGYGVSRADGRFMSKEGSDYSYYKYNDEESRIYLILEKDEATEGIRPLMSLEYRGEDWLYIEKVTFAGAGGETEIDFLRERFDGALLQEIPRASGDVIERILIPVTDGKLDEIGDIIEGSTGVTATYASRYRNRSSEMQLTPQEREGLKTMIKLYHKIKGEKVNGN